MMLSPSDSDFAATLTALAQKYGPVSSHGEKIAFIDGTQPSEAQIKEARAHARLEINRQAAKREARRRILAAMKDLITQQNMTTWFLLNRDTDNAFLIEDVRLVIKVFNWIEETQATGRRLASDQTFADDKHWPQPPDGIEALIARF
jgi:hypothetical protein